MKNKVILFLKNIGQGTKTLFSGIKKEILIAFSIPLSFFLGVSGTIITLHYFPMEFVTVNQEETDIMMDEETISDAIESVYDAVVVIETYKGDNAIGSGTGFVYKKDSKYGYIITNNHVVSEGNKFYATFSDGNRSLATILGKDLFGDIAVLRVPISYIIRVAEIGDSDKLEIGSTVFAIGAPISTDYSGTTTRGCISGTNRQIEVTLDNYNTWLMEVIQTDAAINPGNSGGPLINLAGEVIGVTSSKLVDASVEGIGFAIPINDVMEYVKYLEEGKTISRPVLGITLYDFDDRYLMFYNNYAANTDIDEGAIIGSVSANTSAAAVGLKAGDVITKINDVTIKDAAELRYQLYKHKIGETISLTYYRDGEYKTVSIKLQG